MMRLRDSECTMYNLHSRAWDERMGSIICLPIAHSCMQFPQARLLHCFGCGLQHTCAKPLNENVNINPGKLTMATASFSTDSPNTLMYLSMQAETSSHGVGTRFTRSALKTEKDKEKSRWHSTEAHTQIAPHAHRGPAQHSQVCIGPEA